MTGVKSLIAIYMATAMTVSGAEESTIARIEVPKDCAEAIGKAIEDSSFNKMGKEFGRASHLVNNSVNAGLIEAFMEIHPACPGEDFKTPKGQYEIIGKDL